MKAMNETIEFLRNFLVNKSSTSDAWTFSYEFPKFISERYDDIKKHNYQAAILLNDKAIDLCVALDYEDGDECISEITFRKQMSEILELLLKM